jgi:hypothetical protein
VLGGLPSWQDNEVLCPGREDGERVVLTLSTGAGSAPVTRAEAVRVLAAPPSRHAFRFGCGVAFAGFRQSCISRASGREWPNEGQKRDPASGFCAVGIGEPRQAFYGNQYGLVFPSFRYCGVPLVPWATCSSRSADIGWATHPHVICHIADPPIRSFLCKFPAHGR